MATLILLHGFDLTKSEIKRKANSDYFDEGRLINAKRGRNPNYGIDLQLKCDLIT